MRERPLGLRARIVGVVLFTAVATLAVAAIALLGPLESSLRNAEKITLAKALRGQVQPFEQIQLGRATNDSDVADNLKDAINDLGRRIPATVYVFGDAAPNGSGARTLMAPVISGESLGDVERAFRSGTTVKSFGIFDGRDAAREAIPFTNRRDHRRYVLAVRKPITEIPDAFRAVARAFLYAALAGLALSLILGIPLSARLVRRLRLLREAALQLAAPGGTAEVPIDRAHDEVGDLARTLATMQSRLSRQEKARRAFVATASHELRTPLASLDGMLELLRDDLHDDHPDLQDARALVERAHAQARRLGRLAADLLDLSRIDAHVQMRSEPVELGELSRAVLAEFDLGTEKRGIRSALEDLGGSVWALGDPGSIAQILRILLDNAVRASPVGGEVKVTLARTPRAGISVRDHGPGVSADERDSIFERFRRGRDTAGQAGFGLGLAIGRELAQRMGGELVLEDVPGPGATFTLRLPAARAPEHDPVAVG
ncbi:MAG: sensor histidine kinase [Solirubrobacteraceae bacterium]